MRAILTYHSIDSSGSVISVSPATFDRHVHWLASSGLAIVPLAELLMRPDTDDAVAITFDDGYTNFEREAWPRLRDRGLPVTVFVPTRFVGAKNTWVELPGGRMPELPILGWSALAKLQEEGVTLGAHTRNHPDLRTLDRSAAEDEIRGSFEDLLRETGRCADTFAYPYGFLTPPTTAIVRDACRYACTTELRPLRAGDDAHLLPRLDVFYLAGLARLENFGAASFGAHIRLRSGIRRLGQWARAVRRGGS